MKSIKKLRQVIQRVNELQGCDEQKARIKELLKLFLLDNMTKPKVKPDIWNARPADELRPHMLGMYHDPEVKMGVCCSGYIVIALASEYKEEWAGTIRDKDGNEIEDRYPNWRASVLSGKRLAKYHVSCGELIEQMHLARVMIELSEDSIGDVVIKMSGFYYNADMLLPLLTISGGDIYVFENGRAVMDTEDFVVCSANMCFYRESILVPVGKMGNIEIFID